MAGAGRTSIGGERSFPPTRWSWVQAAANPDAPGHRARMEDLLKTYWRPIYETVRRAWNLTAEDAKDRTQSFLASLLEREFWKTADPTKGRLRHLIRASLRNFMLAAKRDEARIKRGGGQRQASLEALGDDNAVAGGETPEELFDREWALQLMEEASAAARKTLADEGREAWFEIFRRYDLDPPASGPPTYEDLAKDLDMAVHDVRNRLRHVRQRVRHELIQRIALYARDEAEVFEELQEIFQL